MKKTKNKLKILLIISLVFLTTGCATTLTDKDKQPVKNEVTGQNLIENIICKPTDEETIKAYKENGVKIDKLPDCTEFKLNDGKYESLWTTFFIKPLAFIIIKIGELVKNYALAVILVSLAIRLIAYPITRKTALQSELIKKAQPEIQRIQSKYQGKQDQESMMKQNTELLAVYQKYKINPMSGCLFSMLQLPLFIAFFEAIQRTPAIFEDAFIGLQLGTTPAVGITSATFYMYALLVILIGATTYFSFKMNATGNMQDPSMKMMPYMMTGMIIFTSLFMPSALGIYWITTNVFTIIQNILVKRSKEAHGKA